MRALRRVRALAAVSALLLFLAGSALADVPDRPIDSPEGPVPKPVQIGDPDTGQGNLSYWMAMLSATEIQFPLLRGLALVSRRVVDFVADHASRGIGRRY